MGLHVTILGLYFLLSGSVGVVIGALIVALGLSGGFGLGLLDADHPAALFLAGWGLLVGGLVLLLTLPAFLTGVGLLARKRWGRLLGIIMSAISLPGFPVGTIFGAWGLWTLLSEAGAQEFSGPPVPAPGGRFDRSSPRADAVDYYPSSAEPARATSPSRSGGGLVPVLVLLLVMGGSVAGLLWYLRGSDDPEIARVREEAQRLIEAAQLKSGLKEAVPNAPEPGEARGNPMYTWTDDEGIVHAVTDYGQVPEKYRRQVQQRR